MIYNDYFYINMKKPDKMIAYFTFRIDYCLDMADGSILEENINNSGTQITVAQMWNQQ